MTPHQQHAQWLAKRRRDIETSLTPKPRVPLAGGSNDQDAVIAGPISAANGLVDGEGTVYPLENDPKTKNGMRYKLDGKGNKITLTIRNPSAVGFTPSGTGVWRCQIGIVSGSLKLKGVDCPSNGVGSITTP